MRIHPDTGIAEVIVPDFQLSLAIGKEGQNARLAARLSGWRVDIKSETQLAEEESGGGVEYAEGEWVENAVRRARLAAGRGWRDDLGGRGRVRVARPRCRGRRRARRAWGTKPSPGGRSTRRADRSCALGGAAPEPEAAADGVEEPTAPAPQPEADDAPSATIRDEEKEGTVS